MTLRGATRIVAMTLLQDDFGLKVSHLNKAWCRGQDLGFTQQCTELGPNPRSASFWS